MGTHTLCLLEDGPVHPFGQPVHLWRIRYGYFMFDLMFSQVLGKLPASVLSSPLVFSSPIRSPLSPVTLAWNSWNIASVSLFWALKYIAQDLEKSSTKVTMYFLPELEAVCIGPHTSECTFSNRRLKRISPRGFGLCLVALPCTQPSQKLREPHPAAGRRSRLKHTSSLACAHLQSQRRPL